MAVFVSIDVIEGRRRAAFLHVEGVTDADQPCHPSGSGALEVQQLVADAHRKVDVLREGQLHGSGILLVLLLLFVHLVLLVLVGLGILVRQILT